MTIMPLARPPPLAWPFWAGFSDPAFPHVNQDVGSKVIGERSCMVVHVHQSDAVESASGDVEFEIGGLVECRTLREATELIGVTHRFRRVPAKLQHYLTTHLSQFHLSRACNIYPSYS